MARHSNTQFAPSWFSVFEGGSSFGREQRLRAFVRLWTAFMRARIVIAAVLLALQVFVLVTDSGGAAWLVGLCALHLMAAVAVLYWAQPVDHGQIFRLQWLLTVGIDVGVFAALQMLQQANINYTALFVLPVLLASILGPFTLGLGTAAAVTITLLTDAWINAPQLNDAATARFLQAGLTGTGFFLVALLSNQLAIRLAKEEALAISSQAAARNQAEVNELVIESLSEGVLVVDPHGVVRNANPAALTMLLGEGHSGAARLLLSVKDNWAGLSHLVNETFVLGQPLQSEITLDIDELTTHRLYARTRLTVQGGRGRGLCVLFLEDLREVEARVRTEKLASMGRMSAAVAHEIRNPLSAISQANALLDEEVQAPAQKKLTRMIDHNAQRLARIVDDILNVARVQPSQIEGQTTTLPLDASIRFVTQEWAAQNHAGAVLGVHTHAPGAQVAFDPDHLRRLMVNLLDNALKHASGHPSSIRVISQPSGNDRVRVSVWSDGAPLEAGVLKHLFEPFFSSESRSSGLGLYICRELCERYGAQIAYQRTRLDQRDGNEFFVIMAASAVRTRSSVPQNPASPPGESLPSMTRPSSLHGTT